MRIYKPTESKLCGFVVVFIDSLQETPHDPEGVRGGRHSIRDVSEFILLNESALMMKKCRHLTSIFYNAIINV